MRRGEVWWAEIDDPTGSAPGYRRPVVILQADWATASRLRTVTVIAVTSNMSAANAPGNIAVEPRHTGLRKPSVILVSQIITLAREQLAERISRLPSPVMHDVEDGVRMFLDL